MNMITVPITLSVENWITLINCLTDVIKTCSDEELVMLQNVGEQVTPIVIMETGRILNDTIEATEANRN